MLRDIARHYYQNGRNCAEALLEASNEYYDLGLNARDIQLMKAFGGGFGVGAACGALTGALAALSLIYPTTKNAVEAGLRADAAVFVHEFEGLLSHRDCAELKPRYFVPEARCTRTVELGADALEAHIAALNA